MARRSRAVASRARMPSGSREVSGPTIRRALRFRGPSPQVHARCDGAGGRRSSDGSSWATVSRLRRSKSLSKTRPRARVSAASSKTRDQPRFPFRPFGYPDSPKFSDPIQAARQLELAEAERGLSQSMAARALPVLRSIPVDPFAARRAEADRDLAPPHLLRGPGGPPGPGVGRVSPHVGIDHGCIRIEEQDLVAGVREPKDSALHGTRLASVEREIGGRERVLAVTRRIPRDEDAALRGHARIDWEGRRGFAIREGPSG